MQLYAAERLPVRLERLRIGAVMLSLRIFSTKFQSKHCFFNLFLCGRLKIFTLKINTLQIKLQISEK